MNPSLLTTFTQYRCPDWVCPACGSNTLAIKEGSFHSEQTAESRKIWKEDWSGLSDLEFVFVCLLFCERTRCESIIAVSGTGSVIELPEYQRADGDGDTLLIYRAASFIPALPAFDIPPKCPVTVSRPLIQSFSLFLRAPGSAANTIRIALEELMTALGIKSVGSLHRRIEQLPAEYAEHRDALMAIKWLGNAGSHELDKVSSQDIEDAYQIIEFVLRKIYAGSTESIAELITRMTQVFGPQKNIS